MKKLNLTRENTIGEAKDELRKYWTEGVECPCCTQRVQLYRRSITSSMAAVLCIIARLIKPYRDFHLENFLKYHTDIASLRGDAAKLCHWQLLERVIGEREDGNPNTGYYRLTQAGHDFVFKHTIVPKYVAIYNNKTYSFESPDFVNIKDCLGNKFNYHNLINGHAAPSVS